MTSHFWGIFSLSTDLVAELLVNDPVTAPLGARSEVAGLTWSLRSSSLQGPAWSEADVDWKNSKFNLFSKMISLFLQTSKPTLRRRRE